MQQNGSRQFCSDPLWDLDLTWYTEDPDFTHCFQYTILIYVPAFIFALFLPFKWWTWHHTKQGHVPWTPIIGARLVLNLVLIAINLLQFIMEMVWLDKMRPISNIIAPVVLVVTFLLATYVEIQDVKNGISATSSLFLLWFTLAITTTFTFTSFVRFPYDHPAVERVLFFLNYGFIVAQLFLVSWANPPPSHVQLEGKLQGPH